MSGIRAAIFFILCLFVSLVCGAPCIADQTVEKKVVPDFHKDQIPAEKRLNEIFQQLTSNERLVPTLIGKPLLSEYPKEKEQRLFTETLLDSWREKERQKVRDDCGGTYLSQESCGLDYDPFFCAQEVPEFPVFYNTYQKNKDEAIISVAWSKQEKPVAFYRMLKIGREWQVDGVLCSVGDAFNISARDILLLR